MSNIDRNHAALDLFGTGMPLLTSQTFRPVTQLCIRGAKASQVIQFTRRELFSCCIQLREKMARYDLVWPFDRTVLSVHAVSCSFSGIDFCGPESRYVVRNGVPCSCGLCVRSGLTLTLVELYTQLTIVAAVQFIILHPMILSLFVCISS